MPGTSPFHVSLIQPPSSEFHVRNKIQYDKLSRYFFSCVTCKLLRTRHDSALSRNLASIELDHMMMHLRQGQVHQSLRILQEGIARFVQKMIEIRAVRKVPVSLSRKSEGRDQHLFFMSHPIYPTSERLSPGKRIYLKRALREALSRSFRAPSTLRASSRVKVPSSRSANMSTASPSCAWRRRHTSHTTDSKAQDKEQDRWVSACSQYTPHCTFFRRLLSSLVF